MRNRLSGLLLSCLGLACGLGWGPVAAAQETPPAVAEGVPAAGATDRILAVVDDDPILASEVDQVIGLELVERLPGETGEGLRRRVLDQLIERKLRFHEIDRFGFAEVPLEEVEEQLERLREAHRSDEEFAHRLERLGLDEDGLRQILARQIMVLLYVEERLGARVFVDLEDIRAYYEETLVPELEARGAAVPQLAAVREDVRRVLRELRLNEELERWTEELRREADVEIYIDSERTELPPLVVSSEG